MSGSTWLWKGEKEFDRQVIRAAPIEDIRERTATGPNLSMINLLDPLSKACDLGPDRPFMTLRSHDTGRTAFEKFPFEIKKPPRSEEEVHRKV